MIEIIKNIPIQGSDLRLMGTDVFYNTDHTPSPIIIYIHGFNGLKDWANFDLIATQFAEAGYFFVKMNMSHNGATLESPLDFVDLEAFGHNNYSKELFDVTQVIDWICNSSNKFYKFIVPDKIILLGHSRGGGISIIKSAEDTRIKALITWASITECKTPWGNMKHHKMEQWKHDGVMYYANKRTNQQMPLYYQLYEDYQQNKDRLNIQLAIASLQIPVLICHGLQDPAVPFSCALDLKKWQPKATLFEVDANHVFGRSHPWLESYLPKAMQDVVDRSILFLQENFS